MPLTILQRVGKIFLIFTLCIWDYIPSHLLIVTVERRENSILLRGQHLGFPGSNHQAVLESCMVCVCVRVCARVCVCSTMYIWRHKTQPQAWSLEYQCLQLCILVELGVMTITTSWNCLLVPSLSANPNQVIWTSENVVPAEIRMIVFFKTG